MLDSFFQLAYPAQALVATLFTWALTALGPALFFSCGGPTET